MIGDVTFITSKHKHDACEWTLYVALDVTQAPFCGVSAGGRKEVLSSARSGGWKRSVCMSEDDEILDILKKIISS